ncbi:MAG: hypothetical protein DCC49_04850 [Acidobacteria bacterium]|nr:MAG: hypothetical protein DCC49_04850 [Acidobacteriota bacterium]
MPQNPTRIASEWAAQVTFEDLPPHVVEKTKLQAASVLGATFSGLASSKIRAYRRAAARWGAGSGDSELASMSDRLLIETAASVVHDFDDYLFAGHTGHSAILGALAVADLLHSEGTAVSGQDFITAAVVANELGGRLGASMLFGPHNGQMWSYIHLIGASAAGAKLLGLDAGGIESAIGLAFSQPNYPLVATFMGSDAKALIAAQPAVDGAHAAVLAAEGLNGARGILEDRGGFWARFHPDAMAKMFSGFGEAWLTSSLSYKIYPGCAYIDTAIDALFSIMSDFESSEGKALEADDIDGIAVEAGMLTAGMETMSGWYRGEHISPMNVNFSVALSGSVAILAGRLTPAEFEPGFYLEREDQILSLAKKWRIDTSREMTDAISPEGSAFDLRKILRKPDDALTGEDFSRYECRFPARVTLTTSDGRKFTELSEIPLGGAGRPGDETRRLVESKLAEGVAFSGSGERASEMIEAVTSLEMLDDVSGTLRGAAGRWPN